MKSVYFCLYFCLCGLTISGGTSSLNAAERSVAELGRVKARLIYASQNEPETALGEPLQLSIQKELRAQNELNFKHYRSLGHDEQPLSASYDNWLKPLGESKQLLIQFDAAGKKANGVDLNLKLWQEERVILKAAVQLEMGKPLYIKGPAWRGGYILIAVDLVHLTR